MSKLLTLICLSMITTNVLAIDMEYYAPGGIPTISDSFMRLALIFSDSDYKMFFGASAALSMLIALSNGFLIKPLTEGTGKGSPQAFIVPPIIGAVLLSSFFVTATIHVYDPVKNKTESVPGVPQTIVLIAGLTNLIERKMVEITDTASAYPYSKNAEGVNFEMFLSAVKAGKNSKKKYLKEDIRTYTEECGSLSMAVPSLGLTNEQELRTGVASSYAVLAEWVHPGLWLNMRGTDGQYTNMTCTEAWNNVLKPQLALSNFNAEVDELCQQAQYDITDSAQKQACYNLTGQGNKLFGSSSTSSPNLVRESLVASSILQKLNESDPGAATEALIGRQLTLQGMGAIAAEQSTLSANKSIMTAVILGLMPFLTLFLVTSLWSKALKFMVGSMLWLTTWGVMSAVAHAGVMDAAIAVMSDLKSHQMGVEAFMLAETDSVKALMLFGKMQSNALMMATAISMAVYGFGSYAVTGIAQGMAQGVQHTGEQASTQAGTTEGRAGLRKGLASGLADASAVQPPTEGMPNWFGGYGNQVAKASFDAHQSAGAGASYSRTDVGAAGMGQDAGTLNASNTIGNVTGARAVATANNMSLEEQVTQNAQTNAMNQHTRADAQQYIQENLSTDGTQVDGANQLAMNSAYQQFGGVENVRNMTRLNGESPFEKESVMSTMSDMANNNGGLSMTGQEIMNNDKLMENRQDDWISFISDHKDDNFIVHPNFNEQGDLTSAPVSQNFGANTDKSIRENLDNIKSAVTKTDAQTEFGSATLGTAIDNIGELTSNYQQQTAVRGFNSLVDHSTRGEADFNEQERRTLENATVGWWQSTGASFSENIYDSSSKSTTETATIDSNKAALGKIAELTLGVSGSVAGSAIQSTESREQNQFNSLNEVSSKFIDVANGDSQKYAQLVSDFDQHMREMRAEETSSNTGLTSNINNDADKIIKK